MLFGLQGIFRKYSKQANFAQNSMKTGKKRRFWRYTKNKVIFDYDRPRCRCSRSSWAMEGTSTGANKCPKSSIRPSAIARSISAGTPIAPVRSKRLIVLSGTPDRAASVLRDQSLNRRTCLARSPRSVVISFGVLKIRDIILSIVGENSLLQTRYYLLMR